MFKRSYLGMAIAAVIAVPAQAEVETTVILKNETAVYTNSGQRTGQATSTSDTSDSDFGEIMKFENSAKIFFNGDLGNDSSWHGELNAIYDAKGVNSDYKGHKNYTQNDWFRELYADTSLGDWDMRIGKQQVVWGTADGIKLLDIINPTDFREFNQNTTEDARIPVFMFNAETSVGDAGSFQVILSEAQQNQVSGLNTLEDGSTRTNSTLAGTDTGHGFILKGVDTITGKVNGFFNIGAAMGSVTNTFHGGNFTDPASNPNSEFTTVGAFVGGTYQFDTSNPGNALNCSGQPTGGTPINVSGANCLALFTEKTNSFQTNLIDVLPVVDNLGNQLDTTGAGWDTNNPNSTWEYMSNATFATFNTYVGMTTKYERTYEDDFNANLGLRYRTSMKSGLNIGVNYAYAYDANPYVDIHWENSAGETLSVNKYTTDAGTGSATVYQLSNSANTEFYGGEATFNDTSFDDGGAPVAGTDKPFDVDAINTGNNGGSAVLVFEEKIGRTHNIGTSFDYALEAAVPVILRGEFLYTKDVYQPVVDRSALGLGTGNLTAGLTSQKHDFFKYVIGVDVTLLKNLLVSTQFIQFRNLDFIDDGNTYTADPSTLHLTNGLQKGWENKEFYSLFLSKPFGEGQLGRVNNIIIAEEGGGYWDRIDAEYSLSDELIITGEINTYWGDENTTFGQFKNSSNMQIGLKWIIE